MKMHIWSPIKSPTKGQRFLLCDEATSFGEALRSVAHGWRGTWSLVPHVRGDVSAVRCGPVRLLVTDLLSDFAVRKEGRLIATGVFSSQKRRADTWVRSHLLSLDIDDGSEPGRLIEAFADHGVILHGSWNDWREKDGVAQSRYRAYLPLSEPISSRQDYALLWKWAETHCLNYGVTLDPSTKDPNRIMYTVRNGGGRPPTKPGHPAQWIACVPGPSLDPEGLPGGAKLSRMREESERVVARAHKAAARVFTRVAESTRPDLRSAAQRRFMAAVDRLILSREPGTGRNTGVFAAGALLGSYVASGLIDDPGAGRAAIIDAACLSGLRDDIERQLDNGYQRGLVSPLSLEGM